jgi:signal transduction histidine kinase
VRQFYDLEVHCQDDGIGDVELSAPANTALGHVAKESMTNAVRHARAQHIWIHYWLQDAGERICLQVRDDGIGFNVDQCQDNGHGLRAMDEFARQAAGSLKVHSAPGQGTQILVSVPVEERKPLWAF